MLNHFYQKLPDGYIRDHNGMVLPGRTMYVKLWRIVEHLEGRVDTHYTPHDSWRRGKAAYLRYVKSIGGSLDASER